MSFAKNKISLLIGFLICFLFIIYNSVYTVSEGHIKLLSRSINLEKTNPQSITLAEAGLHVKLPFFEQTIPLDMRLHSFSFKKSNILTADGHPLVIDYYTKWHIVNPSLYYLKTRNNTQEVQHQLSQQINTLLQSTYAHNSLNNVVNDEKISILNTVLTKINIQTKSLGITVVDIGFKSIVFPNEANSTLLKNMRAEQERVALQQRVIGKANAENIRALADNQATLLLAKAKEEAAIIRGQGDAIAAKIYSDAYHKNPQFAAFYLNLETFRKGFTQSTSNTNFLVLNTKDELFNIAAKQTPQTYAKELG
ncbi:MAG: protease modulator HflC [Rickettsiella sp.]|nr:protease modulator HflC [Rickettsiella sp.]